MTDEEEKRPLHNAPARLRKVTERKTLRRARTLPYGVSEKDYIIILVTQDQKTVIQRTRYLFALPANQPPPPLYVPLLGANA